MRKTIIIEDSNKILDVIQYERGLLDINTRSIVFISKENLDKLIGQAQKFAIDSKLISNEEIGAIVGRVMTDVPDIGLKECWSIILVKLDYVKFIVDDLLINIIELNYDSL